MPWSLRAGRISAPLGGTSILIATVVGCAAPAPPAALDAPDRPSGSRPAGGPQEPGEDPVESELPPAVPRPDFMRRVPHLPDLLLKDKRDGTYVTGFPAIGYDDEEGAVLGAALQWFNNGSKDDPFFRSTPYRTRIVGAFAFTSEGVARFGAGLDAPYALGSPYRVRGAMSFERNPVERYFGYGESTLDPLSFPGAPGETFDRYDGYKSALRQVNGGTTYAKYDEWESESFKVGGAVEHDLAGGVLRPLVGLSIGHVSVDDYTGEVVEGSGSSAIQRPTHLRDDWDAGSIRGFEGGWDNFLKLGLTLDTRDFEPDPSAGVLGQVSGVLSTRYLGSDFDYQRVTTSIAGYFSPAPDWSRLIFAVRGLYSMQFGDVPFFSASTLSYNTQDRIGLGSYHALRGFKRSRFVGDSAALFSGEVRWYLLEFFAWSEHLRLGGVGFVDTGRVFDDVGWGWDDWKVAGGAGIALAWNLSTVVRFDYAASSEDSIVYFELGHPF